MKEKIDNPLPYYEKPDWYGKTRDLGLYQKETDIDGGCCKCLCHCVNKILCKCICEYIFH